MRISGFATANIAIALVVAAGIALQAGLFDGGGSSSHASTPAESTLPIHPGPTGCTHALVFASDGSPSRNEVALSFDDGPTANTEQLVKILLRYHATATFFLIGDQVKGNEHLLRAMNGGGMELANHSYTHPADLATEGPQATRQLEMTNTAIRDATGFKPCLFRPPFGALTPDLVERAKQLGMTTAKWSVDSSDYLHPGTAVITQRVLDGVRPGDIVVMHDNPETRGQTVAALPGILQGLQSRGYRVVNISTLLGQRFTGAPKAPGSP
jgi:peptidoglycan/xylan/chitin deacetylase (PgdA/CDA1 family)